MKNYTITVFSENKPGVLYRIADMFVRRKVNVESLTVSEIEQTGNSRFTIVVKAETQAHVDKIVKQLERIIEVSHVFAHTDEDVIYTEVAYIKVHFSSAGEKEKIQQLAISHDAVIAFENATSLVVQKTSTEKEIDELHAQLEQFEIQEFTRSGRIAVFKETISIE